MLLNLTYSRFFFNAYEFSKLKNLSLSRCEFIFNYGIEIKDTSYFFSYFIVKYLIIEGVEDRFSQRITLFRKKVKIELE